MKWARFPRERAVVKVSYTDEWADEKRALRRDLKLLPLKKNTHLKVFWEAVDLLRANRSR